MKISLLCRFLSSALLAVSFTLMVQGQTPTPTTTPPRITDEEVVKVSSRLIIVPVSVTDAAGQAVQGLTVNDFRVKEENRQQELDAVRTADQVPLEIALLFDISASTDAMFKFEQETAAKFLRDVMRPIDRATIITVGERARVIQSRDTAERSIASIQSIVPTSQQTAFYDSVRAAAEHLRRNSPEGTRRVIVIISDGEDTNSEGVLRSIWNAERKIADNVQGEALRTVRVRARDAAKVAEQTKVLKALQDADTVFYSINPAGNSFQLNKMSVFGQENMQRFAESTGGTAFLPRFLPVDTADAMRNTSNVRQNSEMLDRIFTQLANELRAQYMVQYYSEAEFPNNKFVKLEVAVPTRPGVKIRARQGYFVKN